MRKKIRMVLGIAVMTLFCTSCQKQELAVPEYPLEEGYVASVMEMVDLPWEIEKTESWAEAHTNHTILEDGRMVANISSAWNDAGRYLNLSFMPSIYDEYGVMQSLEDDLWDNAIQLGTILYGGFADERQVLTRFHEKNLQDLPLKEYLQEDTGGRKVYQEVRVWKESFGTITCSIEIGVLESGKADLQRIIFSENVNLGKDGIVNIGFWLCAVLSIPFAIIGGLFAIFKEEAAKFVAGFNSFSKEEQALYNKAHISRDIRNQYFIWAVIMLIGALLSCFLTPYMAIPTYILWLVLFFKEVHFDNRKAFEKYLLK